MLKYCYIYIANVVSTIERFFFVVYSMCTPGVYKFNFFTLQVALL